MIVLTCLDDRDGMMFNRRRQSQDRLLREDILHMTEGSRLWMNAYSAKQFADTACSSITVAEDFLQHAAAGDYCFVEDQSILPVRECIEKLILYKWNRSYPGNTFFDFPYREWELVETKDFVGSSHDKITKEVYIP